jgi:hypothetical protein
MNWYKVLEDKNLLYMQYNFFFGRGPALVEHGGTLLY